MKVILSTIIILLSLRAITFAATNIKHPIFPQKVDDLEKAIAETKIAMETPDDTLIKWNPPYADFFYCGCPNCIGGSQYRSDNLEWDPSKPDIFTCKYCKQVYPSKEYPLDHSRIVKTPAGTIRTYNYYLGKDGRHYYMVSAMYNQRRYWLREQALLLGQLYTTTQKPEYAYKSAVIIKRFAEIYPEIPIHGPGTSLYNPTFYDEVDLIPEPPDGIQAVPEPYGMDAYCNYKYLYPYSACRAGLRGGFIYDEIPEHLMLAYDQIAETLDRPTRDLIENYFRQVVNYVRTYPRFLLNYDPYLARWEIIAGRVINEPEFVHGGIIRLKLILKTQLYADGMWNEGTPFYGIQVLKAINKAIPYIDGYGDPQGFRSKESGEIIERFNARMNFSRLELLDSALKKLLLPDGEFAVVYDTFKQYRNQGIIGGVDYEYEPLPESKPSLLWAAGHGMLGVGKGINQLQVRLQFMGQFGHYHFDRLGLILYAKGRAMVSDIGYTVNRIRAFASSTLAHNTVMVNTESQKYDANPFGAQVLAFDDQNPTVSFISVKAPQAYDHQGVTVYQRSLACVKVSEEKAYVVDLFEIEGGSRHDWLLHGDADHDGALETTLPLKPKKGSLLPEGKEFKPWDSESGSGSFEKDLKNALGLVRNIKTTHTDNNWNATLKISPDDGKALRITMFAQPETQIICAEIPSIRRARKREGKWMRDNDEDKMKYWMPLLIANRSGENLKSSFLTVHEPYEHEPFIKSISRSEGALIVETGEFTDVHLFGKGNDTYKMSGRYGFLRFKDDTLKEVYLLDGTLLEYRDKKIVLPEPINVNVLKADEEMVMLPGKINVQKNSRIFLTFPTGAVYAIPIYSTTTAFENTKIVLREKVYVEFDSRKADACMLQAFPNTKFKGKITAHIPYSAHKSFTTSR
jgi:hypothetical protein